MKVIGLSGGIATGKSTVASMLNRLGATIIDADQLAREIVQPDQEAWQDIVAAFGTGILREDKTIDREKLRKIVFNDKNARMRLESITHPRIRALAQQKIQQLVSEGTELIIYEAPLLFENQVHLWLRPVIFVGCDLAIQKERLHKRDGLDEREIQQHLEAQMPLEDKRKLADFIIENNSDLEYLQQQVRDLWKRLKK